MNRCLNSPFYNCTGKPLKQVKLHYTLEEHSDTPTKRVWHRNVVCSLEPYYCQHSEPCQLSLTTK